VIALVPHITSLGSEAMQKAAEVLRNRTTPLVGEAFFRALMVSSRGYRPIWLIGILPGSQPRILTLCACADASNRRRLRFRFGGTPCEAALRQRLAFYSSASRTVPNASRLNETGIESYLGVALVSSSGRRSASCVSCTIDPGALRAGRDDAHLYAARVAAEIERSRRKQRCVEVKNCSRR